MSGIQVESSTVIEIPFRSEEDYKLQKEDGVIELDYFGDSFVLAIDDLPLERVEAFGFIIESKEIENIIDIFTKLEKLVV